MRGGGYYIVERGSASERESERQLARGSLVAEFRRGMRGAAQHSVAVLCVVSDKIRTLRLANSYEGQARTALRNLAEHRSLLMAYEHEIHHMSILEKTTGGLSSTTNES